MAYRNDIDALEARHRALEVEVAERTRQRDEVARLVEEARHRERQARVAADWAEGGPRRRRRRMVNLGVAIGAVLVLGLGLVRLATRSADGDRTAQAVLEQLETFTREMCACHEKVCAERVLGEMTKWGQEMSRKVDYSKHRPDAASTERLRQVTQQFSDCTMKALSVNPEAEAPYPQAERASSAGAGR